MEWAVFLGTSRKDVYGNRFRLKRFQRFLAVVDEIVAAKGQCRIIDVGGAYRQWQATEAMWKDRPIQVTLVNLQAQPTEDTRFVGLAGDARNLAQFPDNHFDLVYSNSVIEHVGLWRDRECMAAEIRRLAPRYFVQTPNYWFPIEPHFRLPLIHWLPKPWRVMIVRARRCGFYQRARNISEAHRILDDANLLDAPSMSALFPDAALVHERFLGFSKALLAVK